MDQRIREEDKIICENNTESRTRTQSNVITKPINDMETKVQMGKKTLTWRV